MHVPFESLPEESRIWIYQSNRKFSDAEMTEIEEALQDFERLGGPWYEFGVLLSFKVQSFYYFSSKPRDSSCNGLFN